jgi:hypothetical protein
MWFVCGFLVGVFGRWMVTPASDILSGIACHFRVPVEEFL